MASHYRKQLNRIPAWVYGFPIVGVGLIGHSYVKQRSAGVKFEIGDRLDDKSFVVTGANSGVGFKLAEALARKGGRVYMACRDKDACTKQRREIVLRTSNKRVYCRECDLNSFDSIRQCAEKIIRGGHQIDAVMNCAAVMGPAHTVSADGIESQLQTNAFGPFLLTALLVDRLVKQERPCRIVNFACPAYKKGVIDFEKLSPAKDTYDPELAYRQSKLAMVLLTAELAQRLKDSKVTANVVEPGALIKSNLERHLTHQKYFLGRWAMRLISYPTRKTAAEGAYTPLFLATSPQLDGVSGKHFENCAEVEPTANALERRDQQRLWATAEKWTRLTEQRNKLNEELSKPLPTAVTTTVDPKAEGKAPEIGTRVMIPVS